MARLHPSARQYLTVPADDVPASPGLPQFRFPRVGPTWVAGEWVDDPPTQARVLVAGPDAVANPGGTVVLPLGRTRYDVRLVDAPEDLVEHGQGAIDVY